MSMIRMFTDRAVPSSAVPEEVRRLSQDLGGNLKVRNAGLGSGVFPEDRLTGRLTAGWLDVSRLA